MNTDKKILNEAIILFRKNGYHPTSMNIVSEACGISKGNLTYHYPTKEELFKECINASAGYFKKHVLFSSFENQPTELDGLINFLKNVKNWLTYEGKIIGCMFSNAAIELRLNNPELAELPINYLREFRSILKEKIESGQNNKNILAKESSEVMVENLFLGYEGAVVYSRIENSLRSFDLFIERTYKYFKTKTA